jgi:hypothetical protein
MGCQHVPGEQATVPIERVCVSGRTDGRLGAAAVLHAPAILRVQPIPGKSCAKQLLRHEALCSVRLKPILEGPPYWPTV